VYVTNSHATYSWGLDTASFHEPYPIAGRATLIGQEVADRAFQSGISGCPSGRVCRYADAALLSRNASIAWEFGTIAYTLNAFNYSVPYDTTRAITLAPGQPRSVGEERLAPIDGQQLHKQGFTTGWTFGKVTNTCYNFHIPDTAQTLVCQDEMATPNADGDSGAPVWEADENVSVYLHGIHWGGNGTLTGFSRLGNIERDLGALTTSMF